MLRPCARRHSSCGTPPATGRGDRVDPDLLADTIEPNLADPEFFLRKAIGWALREYARVAPEWVRQYVDGHALSPLSRREALKHL
ncbi:DNA alkylation repair protein [Microbacterium sp. NPDC058062]|uniref:DNA alkylation repair protein n=1 Tax=Microbacterium sp. NPDC058062 TaxID=3346320 RepID=UPI0036DBD091